MTWRIDKGDAAADFLPQFGSIVSLFNNPSPATNAAPVVVAATTTATPTNAVLADMIAHETSGVLTYYGALTVLQDATKTKMTAAEFSALQSAAEQLNVAGGVAASAYAAQLFDDVVLGNSANAYWNGGANVATSLGNLSATSTAAQFKELIGKWFQGTDMPGVAPAPGQGGLPTAYEIYKLPLFTSAGPKITDVNQGQVGDCWYLAALADTALKDPSLISHLIKANGNGTYSVEFQVDGHADYITVNNQLSTYTGNIGQWDGSQMEFANSTSSLWVPLMEKALAQLSEQSGIVTGMEYAPGQNQYYELNGGDGEGISLLTGQATQAYAIGGRNAASLTSLLGSMQSDLSAGNDVMVGTSDAAVGGNLVDDHMFAVTGINATAGTVSLYNPWGANTIGAGIAESFTIGASALASDQAYFFAATGKINVA